MLQFGRFVRELSSRRSRHLVFLIHVWLCAPFLVLWLRDDRVREVLGDATIDQLQPVVGLTMVYLALRTVLAWKDSEGLPWEYIFPPIDVALISLILFISHRGPMSNITLLFFLPMVAASGSLNVRWALAVGFMVVLGTAISTVAALGHQVSVSGPITADILREEKLNVFFRLYFLVILSSLMAYQARIAAELRERLGVAADRNRIAMDMHDGVQGHLITIASQLELIGHVAPRDGDRAAEISREGREMARQAADELRFLVQRLRAPALADGFVPALRQYAHNICERSGLRLTFEVHGDPRPLEPEVENVLFRIAQESLNNVMKHAGASEVSVCVSFDRERASLQIEDNGKGFQPEACADGCVGLASMRERAERQHGNLVIDSAPSKGTTVSATFAA